MKISPPSSAPLQATAPHQIEKCRGFSHSFVVSYTSTQFVPPPPNEALQKLNEGGNSKEKQKQDFQTRIASEIHSLAEKKNLLDKLPKKTEKQTIVNFEIKADRDNCANGECALKNLQVIVSITPDVSGNTALKIEFEKVAKAVMQDKYPPEALFDDGKISFNFAIN